MNLYFLTLTAVLVYSHAWDLNKHRSIEWNKMNFGFHTLRDKKLMTDSGNNVKENGVLIDVQPYYKENSRRVFVTTPRFYEGVPYSLAVISNKKSTQNPKLIPYPDLKAHDHKNGTDCDAIVSAFRMEITPCNQMWVIDTGKVAGKPLCPPKLILIDLQTNVIVHRYPFQTPVYNPVASLLITPVVDVRDPPPSGNCQNTMIYIADVNYPGLVVYDHAQNKAWRVENRFMHPEPSQGIHSLAGERFALMDGIFGMATDKTNLYFHPFSSTKEYSVPLQVLDNSTLFENRAMSMDEAFQLVGDRGAACTVSALAADNLYCISVDPITLFKWNVKSPYQGHTKTKLDNDKYQFVSGMKVVKNSKNDYEIWTASNRFQKLMSGTRNFGEVNFRIDFSPAPQEQPSTPKRNTICRRR